MLSAKTRLGASFVQFAARSREFSNLIFRPSEVQISSRYHAHGSTCWQVISHVPPRRRELRAFRQACFSFEAQLGFIFTTCNGGNARKYRACRFLKYLVTLLPVKFPSLLCSSIAAVYWHSERHLNFWYHLEHALWLSHVSLIFSRLELRTGCDWRAELRRIALGRIKRQNERLADFVSLKSALEKWPVWVFLWVRNLLRTGGDSGKDCQMPIWAKCHRLFAGAATLEALIQGEGNRLTRSAGTARVPMLLRPELTTCRHV